MFTTGTKLLAGGAVLAAVAAVAYGLTQQGTLGTVGLISAAVAMAYLAGVNMYTRDADVSAMDTAATAMSAAAVPPPGASMWPLVGGVGALLVVVGLVSYPVVFVFGLIVLLATAVEWMVQAWAERASGDRSHNADVRGRMAHPLEFPLLGAVGLGIVIYSFSRIMLFLSKSTGPAVFATIAALILLVGFIVAFMPTVRGSAIAVVALLAAVGLVAGGAAAALEGERELHPHETIADLAAAGECDTPDETEADEHASQTVAAKASIAGEVVLGDDDTLTAAPEGVDVDVDTFVVTKSNPTNVRFRNESAEERRLVLDFGTGTTDEGEEVALQHCTALVEEGGSALLTFQIDTASAVAGTPYRFFVPGVDGAELPVEVP